ncbi:TIGR03619 family F420-dependent LLM class oxidoreductase [Siccirubricoccus deserti]
MDFGASMFFTDYSMTPAALGRALEERGFESVWAPEHSHIPVSRKSPWPGGGELPKRYYDCMDPFVSLTAAAAATTKLKLGTGVCLVNQRDPIQTAKLVASLDQLSGGRFLFGIGVGWNQDEMENHGTAFETRAKLTRERIEAMKEIWTKSKAEYHGEFVNFDPIMAWPKPVQKPHPPILVGGAFPRARGGRCATAMAGSRSPAARRCTRCSNASARWPPRLAGIRRAYRSRPSGHRRIPTRSSGSATSGCRALWCRCPQRRRTRSCRSSTAGPS